MRGERAQRGVSGWPAGRVELLRTSDAKKRTELSAAEGKEARPAVAPNDSGDQRPEPGFRVRKDWKTFTDAGPSPATWYKRNGFMEEALPLIILLIQFCYFSTRPYIVLGGEEMDLRSPFVVKVKQSKEIVKVNSLIEDAKGGDTRNVVGSSANRNSSSSSSLPSMFGCAPPLFSRSAAGSPMLGDEDLRSEVAERNLQC